MSKVAISTLVLNKDIFPRLVVDSNWVNRLVAFIEDDVALPPVVADRTTRQVADGFHRIEAARRVEGDDAKVDVVWRTFRNKGEILAYSAYENNRHGMPLCPADQTRFIELAEKCGLRTSRMSAILSMNRERLENLIKSRSVKNTDGEREFIKKTIADFAGETLTPKQIEVNKRLGGSRPEFFFNQVIMLVESRLVKPRLDEKIQETHAVLTSYLKERRLI